MSSFWEDSIRPSNNEFETMEDNTLCLAMIKGVETKAAFDPEGKEPPFFQITWQILEGKYTNRRVWQKLQVFSPDKEKAAKKKGALLRIFDLTNEPTPESRPMLSHLIPLQNKILKILIGVWANDNGEGNYIKNVFEQDYTPKPKKPRSVISIASEDALPPQFNDDIGF